MANKKWPTKEQKKKRMSRAKEASRRMKAEDRVGAASGSDKMVRKGFGHDYSFMKPIERLAGAPGAYTKKPGGSILVNKRTAALKKKPTRKGR